MNKNLILAFGITVLFLGLSINPAIAVNPISSDDEEDCSICPKVSKTHLVRLRRLLSRVETLDNKLSVISKHNPEVAEKYQELSDKITAFTEMKKEVKTEYPYPIICNILYLYMMGFHSIKYALFDSIREILPNILSDFLFWLYVLRNTPFFIALFLYIFEFDCEEFELPDTW